MRKHALPVRPRRRTAPLGEADLVDAGPAVPRRLEQHNAEAGRVPPGGPGLGNERHVELGLDRRALDHLRRGCRHAHLQHDLAQLHGPVVHPHDGHRQAVVRRHRAQQRAADQGDQHHGQHAPVRLERAHDGRLQAVADGELARAPRLRAAVHVRRRALGRARRGERQRRERQPRDEARRPRAARRRRLALLQQPRRRRPLVLGRGP